MRVHVYLKRVFGPLACLAICVHSTTWAAAALVTAPSDLSVGQKYHLAFVTAGTGIAGSSIIGDYNTIVTTAANAVPELNALAVDWYVIGSTWDTDAKENAIVSAPVYDLHGTRIANSYEDFWDGSLIHPIAVTEQDTTISTYVWTGSYPDGTAISTAIYGSYNWHLGAGTVRVGNTTRSDLGWIYANSAFSSTSSYFPYYALSGVLTATDSGGGAIPEPTTLVIWSLLGTLGIVVGWWRRRKAV